MELAQGHVKWQHTLLLYYHRGSDKCLSHVHTCWSCGTPLKHTFFVAAAPPLKPGDNGIVVGGDHERDGAQELEKAENEENNAGERGDGQYW